ncbi:MAG: hypothetical protein ACOC9W_01370 [Persicimonas sp.]
MAATITTGCGDDDDSQRSIQGSGDDENTADAGADTDADQTRDAGSDADLPGAPESVETVLSDSTVAAGTTVEVECQLLDADGRQVEPRGEPEAHLSYAPQQSFVEEDDLSLVPTTAGNATIACQYAELSLIDDTPAELTVEAGQPHTVTTDLDRYISTAGEPVTASCEVFDAYGNPVEDAETELVVDASGNGIGVDGHTATITRAGIYTLTCTSDGASQERGEALEVNPGLPADLAISKVPDLPYYDTGQVVDVATIVTDEYGNRVEDAYVDFVSDPQGDGFGHGRFRYWSEGTYTVTATVEGETKDDATLEDSVEIVVNGEGPSIDCISPADGEMQEASPGDTVTFRGQVEDAQGIDLVTVNQDSVTVDQDGYFEHDVTVRFGINFVDILATDGASGEFREENSTTCAFLTSDTWGDEDDFLDDAVSLWIGQESVDDKDTSDPLDSLNDILHTVLNSHGLRDQIHTSLLAQNPLAEGTTLLVYDYEIHYIDSRIHGPHDTELDLISDGISLESVIRDVEIDVREVNLGVNSTATIHQLDAELDATMSLANGQPSLQVRPNSVSVTSGRIDLTLTGWGWLDDVISDIVQPTLRSTVEDEVEKFLKDQVNDMLDDVVGSLDISSLGSTFDVPRLDGTGDLPLNFGVNFSSLGVNTARALFGLGTEFSPGSTERATPSLGVPMPAGQKLMTADPNRPISAAIHLGALNYVFHSLWRGGLFDAAISDSAIGSSFPDGTEITLSTGLPPVAALQGSDKIELMLGAINMSIVYPGLFDEPIDVRVGALARSGVTLNGDQLSFHDIQINELYFSPVGLTLDANSRDVLETFLRDVLQDVMDTSLNNALPALPIPSFTIPSSLGTYGLPAGDNLGIVQPSLGGTTLHFVLKGAFGILP